MIVMGSRVLVYRGDADPAVDVPVASLYTSGSRLAVLADLFDWLEQTRGGPDVSITLTSGGEGVMVEDGNHFLLFLTQGQYDALQECWAGYGLPRDVCTDVDEEDVATGASRTDPNDARRRFVGACGQLLGEVGQRLLNLDYPANEAEEEEVRLLHALDAALGRAMLRAAGFTTRF